MKRKIPATSFLFLVMIVLTAVQLAGGRTTLATTTDSHDQFAYLAIFEHPTSTDLAVTGLEVTQAVQTAGGDVPVVAGKETVVRIYAEVLAGNSPADVTIDLVARRGGAVIGTETAGPAVIPQSADRDDLSTTFNLTLPEAWLSGVVELSATIDPDDVVNEIDETNNSDEVTVTFVDVPDLDIKIVPIDYTHQGFVDPGFYPGEQVDPISDWIGRAFPIDEVSISYRTPVAFSGDLDSANDWSNLLDLVSAVKAGDGAPFSQVYYALVPISNGSNQWFTSGFAGIGWIQRFDARISVGVNFGFNDTTGSLAGHEIGHNFGRYHAPGCGAQGLDPAFPSAYVDGSGRATIGQFGLDIDGPSVFLKAPDENYDIMSYCSNEWVSDYTYEALLGDQLDHGLWSGSALVRQLLLRATIDESGRFLLRPLYAFTAPAAPVSRMGRYRAEFLRDGHVVASGMLDVAVAQEDGMAHEAIHALIPLPDVAFDGVRLVEDGRVLAARSLQDRPANSMPAVASQLSGGDQTLVAWGYPEVPAIVRHTADGGQTWVTLGVDVVGGRLEVDNDALSGEGGRFEIILADTIAQSPLEAAALE